MKDRSVLSPSRRRFLGGGAALSALALSGCAASRPSARDRAATAPPSVPPGDYGNDYALIYGPMPEEQFPLPAVKLQQVNSRYYRREVVNDTGQPPGTVIVDTGNFYLYWTKPGGTAIRYGVGLGREGFEWSGNGVIQWKQRWPKWTPPEEMIAREPELAKYSVDNGGMPPGLKNPLGARALYIFQNGEDTLYRLHGTPEAFSIGKAVSSGCVRLLNHDVIDLYERVPNGSPILVI